MNTEAGLSLKDVGFIYPDGTRALSGISMDISRGEFVLLSGRSGCGKSTLLRLIKQELAPKGEFFGEIIIGNQPAASVDKRERAERVAYVGQNPEGQIVTDRVWHELAFGLENLGLPSEKIRIKVAEIASYFGIEKWFRKPVEELSGGQKQILTLASAIALEPDILLLDEPTAQLDPMASGDLITAVGRINKELGITVIISEQRLDEVMALSDTAVVMDRGQILFQGRPEAAAPALVKMGHSMFFSMPVPARVFALVDQSSTVPITVREGRQWLSKFSENNTFCPLPHKNIQASHEPVVQLRDVWFRYDREGEDVLRDFRLTVRRGELYAILGGNGTGKTTALSVICGLYQPYRGRVRTAGRVGVLPQDPQMLFQHSTVRQELAGGEGVIAFCGLEELLDRHPYDLSGGEQQRLALAKVLQAKPDILILDEPEKGLDASFKADLGRRLTELTQSGVTVILVSHDTEFCGAYAHKCALFFDGSIMAEGEPREFFSGNRFYTTAAARMARGLVPEAVTAEDLIAACAGQVPELSDDNFNGPTLQGDERNRATEKRVKRNKKSNFISVCLLLLMPLTLLGGIYLMGDRKYAIISLLMMAEAFAGVVVRFEGRRPRAREIVVVSALCALGVIGRAAFFMLPQVKPVAAIVIISGVALGGEAGFLVGAATGLISNLFFGQGPWTPWQMLAYGVLGLIAGAMFRRGDKTNRLLLCVLGGIGVFIIYGGLMNVASVIMYQPSPTWEMVLSAILLGIPFDAVHAISTGLFLFILSKPFLAKLERIKTKYGLLFG